MPGLGATIEASGNATLTKAALSPGCRFDEGRGGEGPQFSTTVCFCLMRRMRGRSCGKGDEMEVESGTGCAQCRRPLCALATCSGKADSRLSLFVIDGADLRNAVILLGRSSFEKILGHQPACVRATGPVRSGMFWSGQSLEDLYGSASARARWAARRSFFNRRDAGKEAQPGQRHAGRPSRACRKTHREGHWTVAAPEGDVASSKAGSWCSQTVARTCPHCRPVRDGKGDYDLATHCPPHHYPTLYPTSHSGSKNDQLAVQ
jgi:hypothetical protein